ncbi:MAG: hypothetical protein EOM50_23320 [Erysipelotrichia bacterium]|nr:hypothetical protein [Erysipelotrichia bacterium]
MDCWASLRCARTVNVPGQYLNILFLSQKDFTKKWRMSRLAFFVVPVIGGFISNLSNAVIISGFINYCIGLLK